MSKKNDERRDEITKLLLAEEELTVGHLANKLNVSLETIRSDLTFLEKKGILFRNHGGARIRLNNAELPMEIRMAENKEAKKRISYAAINLIKDDMTIYIDPSSTALPLGRLLRIKKNLTIVTNSYELIPVVAQTNHKIIILSGEYNRDGKRFIGLSGLNQIKNFHFDMCFIGADGFIENGPAIVNYDESILDQEIIKNSNQTVLLTDCTKFNKTSPFNNCRWEDIDYLVTDKMNNEDKAKCKGIKNIIVAKEL